MGFLTRKIVPLAVTLGMSAAVVAVPAQANASTDQAVVRSIERHAYPLASTEPAGALRDLRPLGRMVGDAAVVGLGEATHGSHEFFTLKHRVFRYLVEEKGFRAFSLETSWSTGLRLNDYVLYGKGDPLQIMREEFRGLPPWQNQEYLDLIEWMRDYNQRHPGALHFAGNDITYPTLGTELCDRVTAYVERHHPELLPTFNRLYARLRTMPDADAFLALPKADREEVAGQAQQAYELLRSQNAQVWPLQHAKVLAQSLRVFAFDLTDPAGVAQAMYHRDQAMAENTAWWYRHTGQRVLLSAHNGHVAYETFLPEQYPKVQGAFLRELLGRRYVAVGASFDHGSFKARGPDGRWTTTHEVPPAEPDSNEYTLDRVKYDDYVVDLRRTTGIAREWLGTKRPTWDFGTEYPWPRSMVALRPSYDVLIHLDTVRAAATL
jgi:erythromycin esterase